MGCVVLVGEVIIDCGIVGGVGWVVVWCIEDIQSHPPHLVAQAAHLLRSPALPRCTPALIL